MTDTGRRRSPRRGQVRVLVIRRRYLGDTVLAQPMLRNLREHWPDAWVTLVVDTPYVDTLASCHEVDEILEIPAGRLGLGMQVARWTRTMRGVTRGAPFDLALDFARNERAHLLLVASRARRRATIAVGSGLRRRRLYTDVLSVTRTDVDAVHTVDMNNRLLETVGIPALFRVPAVPVPAAGRAAAVEILAGLSALPASDRRLLMVHPGSGSESRRWPPPSFAQVADRAVAELGARVVVLYGRGEVELARSIVGAMRNPAALLPDPPTVPVLFGLLAQADMLLCNDSGPMHMAAAVGTPVCAVYGSQSVTTWAPLGPAGHLTFQAPLPCGEHCLAPGTCDRGDPMKSVCVRRIGPDEVAAGLVSRLARSPSAT